jgi:flagellin
MRINTNVSSLTAQEAATNTGNRITSSLEKLSTGLKINKASDDSSGLAIADKLRTQANGLNQAVSNGNSAIALTQIADKAMGEQSNILDTLKSKLIQMSTATTSLEGAKSIAKDITKLIDQIDNIAKQTEYNGQSLLKASAAGSETLELKFQMGVSTGDTISLKAGIFSTQSGLAVSSLYDSAVGAGWATGTSAQDSARGFLATVDTALTKLNGWRADIGSTQNQVESAVRNIQTQVTNVKAAESVIRDVDYAQESANFNKQNIISQAGSYAISQANAVQQNVLRLLQ